MPRPALFLLALATSRMIAQAPTSPVLTLSTFYTGASSPVGIYHCGDSRLFILEQSQGDIEIISSSGAYIGKFLDVTGLISTGGERGLLGLAFHPQYQQNGYFYINYTNTAGHTVVARYQASADPNVADPASAQIVLTINQPYSNHNGGHIAFGPDGYLYIGMGDGGSAGDPQNYAQNTQSLLGKMLRIDVDGGSPYAIPSDNPFVGVPGHAPEIWAIGLRNPWKFHFDDLSGDLWIADVGQNTFEEVNLEPAESDGGMNWGWRCYEANAVSNGSGCQAAASYDYPVAVFAHAAPDVFCSITGGAVYRGNQHPLLFGYYLLTDYCNGDFYGLYPDGNGGYAEAALLQTSFNGFTAIGEGADGELYAVRLNGTIYRIGEQCGTFSPVVQSNGNGQLTCTGGENIWWWKDGNLLPGATGPTYTPTSGGTYHATASLGACIRQSNSVDWIVQSGVGGCTYPLALNYNPVADVDDGSCDFGTAGCTYPDAVNFNPQASRDDGSCDFGTPGCTYPLALNYDPAAVRDDGSCQFGAPGCTYPEASNYHPDAQLDNGSCIFPGGSECPVDLNSDGIVNTGDLFLFIASWGLVCD